MHNIRGTYLLCKYAENSKLAVYFPAGNYIFKVKNRNTRRRCKICLKLPIKLTLSR